MKNFILLNLLIIVLLINACSPAYVSSQPTYVAVERPQRPDNIQVWIDGDWMWSRQSHSYMYHDGFWTIPHHGQAYIPGHWRTNRRGSYWSNGYWH